jgi:hypothetical protein
VADVRQAWAKSLPGLHPRPGACGPVVRTTASRQDLAISQWGKNFHDSGGVVFGTCSNISLTASKTPVPRSVICVHDHVKCLGNCFGKGDELLEHTKTFEVLNASTLPIPPEATFRQMTTYAEKLILYPPFCIHARLRLTISLVLTALEPARATAKSSCFTMYVPLVIQNKRFSSMVFASM